MTFFNSIHIRCYYCHYYSATAWHSSLVLCVLNLLSLEAGSLRGWLAGVGEAGLRSSAGETLEGLVVANSSTNCSMSARGYLAGPEP